MDLTRSLDYWMTAGGDERHRRDASTGLSRYRTSSRPRPSAPLGSCSASSPTARSWAAAGRVLSSWRGERSSDAVLEATASGVRARLREALGLDPRCAVALTPSGTDAVYLASAYALRGVERIHHIVVGANELGSGTMTAAEGRTFCERAPHGGVRRAGAAVEGLRGRTRAEAVYVRGRNGRPLPPEEIDARVVERARAALRHADRVVLHLVTHSKTGLRAPTLSAADALVAEHGDRVVVLVDAAQARRSPHETREALERGFLVLVTGSKFYGGPPFSGALLLSDPSDPQGLPAGLSSWLARSDLPGSWRRARASLRAPHNPGLLLRWTAALSEIEAYHAVDPHLRVQVRRRFADAVPGILGSSPVVDLEVPRPPDDGPATDACPTVFSFRVRDGHAPMDAAALRRIHALLDTDLSAVAPELGRLFHLGQPVSLGPPSDEASAVLRVSLGAPLVTRLAGTADHGAGWLGDCLTGLRAKLECLIELGLHREVR